MQHDNYRICDLEYNVFIHCNMQHGDAVSDCVKVKTEKKESNDLIYSK